MFITFYNTTLVTILRADVYDGSRLQPLSASMTLFNITENIKIFQVSRLIALIIHINNNWKVYVELSFLQNCNYCVLVLFKYLSHFQFSSVLSCQFNNLFILQIFAHDVHFKFECEILMNYYTLVILIAGTQCLCLFK